MKVEIDAELCSGHGRCRILAGSVYRLDDEGYNADRGAIIDVSPENEAVAVRGMKSCPEAAISIVD
jgi:ferredoxin